MKYLFGKIQIAITFLMIASISYSYGDYNNTSFYEDCNSCEPTCCEPSCCIHGYVSAEFLYWRAFQSGLCQCIPETITDTISDGIVTSTVRGRGRNPRFNWDPGFRIGLGTELGCNWDIAATWTHLHSTAHRNSSLNKIRWKVDFDVVDLVAVYEARISPCFALYPFAGLRGARIEQKLSFEETVLIVGSDVDTFDISNRETFNGAGPLIGLELDFNIWCDLSLYANASVGWLYGNYKVRFNEFDETEDTISSTRIRSRLDGTLGCVDAGIGIRWQQCFYNTKLILGVGLEHHRYFDYNRFGDYGDLSFDGINVSAGIAF